MQNEARDLRYSGSRLTALTCGIAAVLLVALPQASAGGVGLITLNQQPTFEALPGACSWAWNCTPNQDPPFVTIAQGDYGIGAFSYHVNPYYPLDSEHLEQGRFCQATCKYRYWSRPKIISTDHKCVTPEAVGTWLTKICEDATHYPGRLHLEHYDWSLEEDYAKLGLCIGGFATWPAASKTIIGYFDDHGESCPSILAPNGEILHPAGLARLSWKGVWGSPPAQHESYVTLAGFGFMGVIAMGDRIDTLAFLRSLRSHRANLIRIWAVEEWAGLAPNQCTSQDEGPTPFSGFRASGSYDLATPNPVFYRGLRDFAQQAADRGVVVQLSVFDKWGLARMPPACQAGTWFDSPYKDENNIQVGFMASDWPSSCNCPIPGCPTEEVETGCVAPPKFITSDYLELPGLHAAYLERLAEEVGGIGNVFFELVNEQNHDSDWPDTADPGAINDGEEWQAAIASQLRMMLPTFVTRDAFNDEDPVTLAGKRSDDYRMWQGVSNAFVAGVSTDPETGIRMGAVKGSPTSTTYEMKGSLPLGSGSRTGLSVRADISRNSNSMELGFSSGGGEWLRVELGAPPILSPSTRVAIVKKVGSQTTTLASTTWGIGVGTNIRLSVDLSNQSNPTGTVFVDSLPLPALTNVPLSTLPALNWAYFRGSTASGYYTDTSGWIDNFEADIFCNNTGAPFNCTP